MVVTSECHASTVIGVPPYAAVNAFKDITCIKAFGVDGLVTCCLLENALEPTAIGAVRRVTLALPTFEETILRERLVAVEPGPHRTTVRMEYVPCSREEARRSPFGAEGTRLLLGASTCVTVTAISVNPNRCFVEMSTTFTVNLEVPPDGAKRAMDNSVYRNIALFWDMYVLRTVSALENYLLSIAFPEVGRNAVMEYQNDLNEAEEAFCRWAARSSATIPRTEAMETLEKALNTCLRIQRELKHQQLMNARLQDDAAGSMAVAAAAAAAAAVAAAEAAEKRAACAIQEEASPSPHSDPNPPRRTTAAAPLGPSAVSICAKQSDEVEKTVAEADIRPGTPTPQNMTFFSPGGGRCLSVPTSEHGEPQQQQEPQCSVPPHRPAPLEFQPEFLKNFLTDRGTINEKQAQALFSMLDAKQDGFITKRGIATVLGQMDPLGLYEDRDGTLLQVTESRQAVGTGVFRGIAAAAAAPCITATDSIPGVTPMRESNETAMEEKETLAAPAQLTPLQTLVRRHDAQKKVMHEKAIEERSEAMLKTYAYRTRGRLHYDEFCLMMLHLLKEY